MHYVVCSYFRHETYPQIRGVYPTYSDAMAAAEKLAAAEAFAAEGIQVQSWRGSKAETLASWEASPGGYLRLL